LIGFFLGYLPFLKKFFTTKNEMEEEFYQKALESFLLNGVVDTTHRNGVQLYVSALEHKAIVLVDKGLKEKLSQETWDQVLVKLTGPLKRKAYAEGIIAAVDEVGLILKEHFPSDQRTADELPNKLIIDL
jgi:putative membrane protein